jgi:hypothetical protein
VPPDESVHEVSLNVPPALLSFIDSAPVGVAVVRDVSETDIVSATGPPELIVVGFDVMLIAVLSNDVTAKGVDPKLAEWEESPL